MPLVSPTPPMTPLPPGPPTRVVARRGYQAPVARRRAVEPEPHSAIAGQSPPSPRMSAIAPLQRSAHIAHDARVAHTPRCHLRQDAHDSAASRTAQPGRRSEQRKCGRTAAAKMRRAISTQTLPSQKSPDAMPQQGRGHTAHAARLAHATSDAPSGRPQWMGPAVSVEAGTCPSLLPRQARARRPRRRRPPCRTALPHGSAAARQRPCRGGRVARRRLRCRQRRRPRRGKASPRPTMGQGRPRPPMPAGGRSTPSHPRRVERHRPFTSEKRRRRCRQGVGSRPRATSQACSPQTWPRGTATGRPPTVLRLLGAQWSAQQRWISGVVGTRSVGVRALPQGCPWAPIAMPAIMAAAVASQRVAFAQILYLDDRMLRARSVADLQQGLEAWRRIEEVTGMAESISKRQVWGSMPASAAAVQQPPRGRSEQPSARRSTGGGRSAPCRRPSTEGLQVGEPGGAGTVAAGGSEETRRCGLDRSRRLASRLGRTRRGQLPTGADDGAPFRAPAGTSPMGTGLRPSLFERASAALGRHAGAGMVPHGGMVFQSTRYVWCPGAAAELLPPLWVQASNAAARALAIGEGCGGQRTGCSAHLLFLVSCLSSLLLPLSFVLFFFSFLPSSPSYSSFFVRPLVPMHVCRQIRRLVRPPRLAAPSVAQGCACERRAKQKCRSNLQWARPTVILKGRSWRLLRGPPSIGPGLGSGLLDLSAGTAAAMPNDAPAKRRVSCGQGFCVWQVPLFDQKRSWACGHP